MNDNGNKTAYVAEPARQTEVRHSCGVLVCGGGIAGAAAALAARRSGADVMLIEREYALGGLATLGLVTIYLPLCDGCGRQVSYGLAEELLRLSIIHGGEGEIDGNPWLTGGTAEEKCCQRFRVRYNANMFAIDLEQQLLSEGVRILYGTSVCAVSGSGGKIEHVIVENRSGRSAIAAQCVIDATGDARVCALSAADTAVFAQGNIPAAWFYHTSGGSYRLNMLGFSDIPDSMKSAEQLERDKTSLRFAGLEAEEVSTLTALSHRMLRDEFLKGGADSESHALSTIASIPQLRMTRRLAGDYTMDDSEQHTAFDDSIGLISDWRKAGPVYELPFGTMKSEKVGNLFAAGRCISVTDAMWDITRVIPACAVTGQAAGIAAALTCAAGHADIRTLQAELRRAGVPLHESKI